MTEPTKIEYRIREVKRFAVTRYEETPDGSGGCMTKGTYDNGQIAHEAAYALAREEHGRLGWPVGDERIQYPHPTLASLPVGVA